ncbi:MAG: helix-turn-helix transcriptional regulator [Ginsengibacter sp.]
MPIHRNIVVTQAIGKKIKELRVSKELEIEDISEMTGFTSNNIRAIEKGKESRISTLAEIAFAIGVQLHDITNINFKIKPRFKLSGTRKEKTKLTQRVNHLVVSNYFREPKYVKNVLSLLMNEYKIKTTSSSVSAILLRIVEEGKLKVKRVGRQNQYSNPHLKNS